MEPKYKHYKNSKLLIISLLIFASTINTNISAQCDQTWKFVENNDSIVYIITKISNNKIIIRIESNNRAFHYRQNAYYQDTFDIYWDTSTNDFYLKYTENSESSISFKCAQGNFGSINTEPILTSIIDSDSGYEVNVLGILTNASHQLLLYDRVYLYFTKEHIPIGFSINFDTQRGNEVKLNNKQIDIIKYIIRAF